MSETPQASELSCLEPVDLLAQYTICKTSNVFNHLIQTKNNIQNENSLEALF